MKLIIDKYEFGINDEGIIINSNPPSEIFVIDEEGIFGYFKDRVLKFVDMSGDLAGHNCRRCYFYQFKDTICGNNSCKMEMYCSPGNGSKGKNKIGYWIDTVMIQVLPQPKLPKRSFNLVQTDLEKELIDQLL
jgi:hypothetical protein